MKSTLTDKQKRRLQILESQLELAVSNRDYTTAKSLVLDIQTELQSPGHYIRLIKAKNKLYELAIELKDFEFAINGLFFNRHVLSDKTRIYLETNTLLAICFIRMLEIEKAKAFIKEVLMNDGKPGNWHKTDSGFYHC